MLTTISFAVLVPVRVPTSFWLDGMAHSLHQVLDAFPQSRAIIVDDSAPHVFAELDVELKHSRLLHVPLDPRFVTGDNNKMNGVETGLHLVEEDLIILIDDDFRLTLPAVERILARIQETDCDFMRCAFRYVEPNLSDWLNLAEQFFAHAIDHRLQPGGHCVFRKSKLDEIGLPDKNVASDDLEFLLHFEDNGARMLFASDIVLDMVTHGWSKFFQQRVYYAFETISYPAVFALALLQLPGLVALALLRPVWAKRVALAWFGAVAAVGFYGRQKHLRRVTPWWSPLLLPFLGLIYVVAVWIALYKYLSGEGVPLGPYHIKKPASRAVWLRVELRREKLDEKRE